MSVEICEEKVISDRQMPYHLQQEKKNQKKKQNKKEGEKKGEKKRKRKKKNFQFSTTFLKTVSVWNDDNEIEKSYYQSTE